MSSDKQQTPSDGAHGSEEGGTSQRVFWRSLEHKANPEAVSDAAGGSDVVKRNVSSNELFSINRRKFLTLSGAIGTLAGVEGCIRRPVEKIMPYSDMPEYVNPGVPLHYATVTNAGGQPLGLVVTTHEGRPTKVEGNPDHPASLGATDIWAQSSILDLYDPERSRQPYQMGAPSTFAEFDKFLSAKIAELKPTGGAGLFILAQPTSSPSFVRLRELVVRALPRASFVTYSPVTEGNARLGAVIAFGQPVMALPDFSRAKIVLSLDSDFMGSDPGSTLATRGFAQAREVSGTGEMNRLYAVEPMLSITGSNADHRLRLAGQDIGRYARALAAELSTNHGVDLGQLSAAVRGTATDGIPDAWLKAVAKDLVSNRGRSLIVVGYRHPPAVHALVAALNRGLGNLGSTISYVTPVDQTEVDPFVALTYLQREIEEGRVKTLITLGGNPVYDAPGDLRFGEVYKKIPTTIHFSGYFDETAALATWQVPRAHELESWGDARGLSGHYSVQQPLIAPLWGGRSDIELLAQLASLPAWRGHDVVQATVQGLGLRGELAWRQLLNKGVSAQRFAEAIPNLSVRDAEVAGALKQVGEAAPLAEGTFEAVFVPDPKVYDGRYLNNTWLLELPDPLTRIVWDNALLIAPSTAKELGIENGDLVRVKKGDVAIDIAAWRQPGVAPRSLVLPLGWGRTKAGSNGNKRGFDVNPLRASATPHFLAGVTLEKLGRKYTLTTTQDHDVMEGRPIALDTTLTEYKQKPNFVAFKSPDPHYGPLWAAQDYSQGNQWGMAIDLNTCSGCSACVIACQAENNIPVVGKDQVARGREMAWLRIDRYYVGDNEDEPEVAFQAIACQHCETAPCENVCPVAATAHSPEGLNDIAYNRCIGTRYCMNNCPYKVRRFNFLNYNEDIPETRQMQMNPNVTVRFRGVIEKCSYCVQRIQNAKIKAKVQGRRELKEGEVVVACQQACASGSIVFGDINDTNSAFSKKYKEERGYALLAEIGTRPRTRFLGKIRNPNPEMKA